jgi:hypothetical protein
MLCEAAIEQAEAAAAVLAGSPHASIALDALARAGVEAASQAWWLLEPGVGARNRVVRLFLLYRASARALDGVAQQLPPLSSPPPGTYGAAVSQLDARFVTDLGIAPVTGAGNARAPLACEGQTLPGYTKRAKQFADDLDIKGIYSYYSGGAHVELWRVLQGRKETVNGTGQTVSVPAPAPDAIRSAVQTTIDACLHPMLQLGEHFGWTYERPTVEALVDDVSSAFEEAI